MKPILLSLCCILAFSSCAKTIVLDAEAEPKVVVECILDNTKKEQTLYLGYTKGKLKSSYPALSEADAVLFDKTVNQQAGKFTHCTDDEWSLEYIPVEGHEYRLEIEVPGYGKIWAECQMPQPVSFFEIQGSAFVNALSVSPGYRDGSLPDVDRSKNPSDLPKRMEYTNGICYKYTPTSCQISVRLFTMSDADGERFFASKIASDVCAQYMDNILGDTYIVGEEDFAHMLVITSLSNHLWTTAIYPSVAGRPYCNGTIVFDGSVDDSEGNYFVVGADLRTKDNDRWFQSDQWHQYVLIESLPSILTEYRRRIEQLLEKKESTDYTTLFLRDNLPSNINGGIGIFSGKQEQVLPWRYEHSLYQETEQLSK